MVCLEVDWFDEARRDAFMQALKARGIDSRPYFCTMSSMPMYRPGFVAGLGPQGADRTEPAVLFRADEGLRFSASELIVNELLDDARGMKVSCHEIKLGVLALAGPDIGGTYQYTLSDVAGVAAHERLENYAVRRSGKPRFRQNGLPDYTQLREIG